MLSGIDPQAIEHKPIFTMAVTIACFASLIVFFVCTGIGLPIGSVFLRRTSSDSRST
jgi:hypothetical protein